MATQMLQSDLGAAIKTPECSVNPPLKIVYQGGLQER